MFQMKIAIIVLLTWAIFACTKVQLDPTPVAAPSPPPPSPSGTVVLQIDGDTNLHILNITNAEYSGSINKGAFGFGATGDSITCSMGLWASAWNFSWTYYLYGQLTFVYEDATCNGSVTFQSNVPGPLYSGKLAKTGAFAVTFSGQYYNNFADEFGVGQLNGSIKDIGGNSHNVIGYFEIYHIQHPFN